MDRRYFKKNINQTDLFDLVLQLDDIKKMRHIESELLAMKMMSPPELAELEAKPVKNEAHSEWTQLSIESLFNIHFTKR